MTTVPSRFFVGGYDAGMQVGTIWLELAGDGTFELQEHFVELFGATFLRVWKGEWSETDAAVTLSVREHYGPSNGFRGHVSQWYRSSSHPPGSTLALERRESGLVYDESTTLAPSEPPPDWRRRPSRDT